LDEFARRLGDTWGDLSPVRKGLLSATAIALVVLGIVFFQWSSQTRMVTLYSGLDASDSGRIIEELRAQGVDYRIDGGGASVSVPEDRVDDLRVDFAAQGLPEGGHVGFEIFEGNSFTATDFVQRLNFQRSLQGELARTIETFPAVERARVHIVMPERSLFRNDQRPATASVVLRLRPGRALASNEVNGIAHLVSGAVEGLEKAQITILDSSGTMLYDGSQAASQEGFGLTATQMSLQREYERALERDVQTLLDRALGPARALVSVRARLNFDRSETETESYAPGQEGGVPRSTTSVTETYTANGGATAGAVPGAVANVPGANADLPGGAAGVAGDADSATAYERTENTSNFEVGRSVTRSIAATGNVQHLSVSLLLDESVTEAQATALEASVAAAAGIDAERGDAIVMNRIPFDRTALNEAVAAFEAEASSEQLLTYARMALPAVLLVVAFILFRLLMRSVSRRSYYGVTVDDGLALPAGVGTDQLSPAAVGALRGIPAPDEIKRSDLEVQVSKLATNHPETVAEVVQSWLRED
jgi:flagellar M-ring protein FliF